MKRFFIIFPIFLLVFLGVNMPQSIAQKITTKQETPKNNIKKVELSVSGMTCQKGCADGIDKKLNMTYGIVRSKTNFEKGKSVVSYDPSLITVAEIIKVIKDKGYEAKQR
ncbi:MAG: heavy-metal-associated domain-containing protein [Saprospiraceae bacterium]|nr:heavy-metal-associated domain-containing protein [Saprospiraceae bacterium]